MVRGIAVSLVVFLVLFGVGAGFTYWRSSSDSVINPTRIAQAQGASGFGGPAGDLVDAGLDRLGMGGGAAAQSNAEVANAISRLISEARGALILWFGLTMLAGLAASDLWLFLASRREKTAVGPQGQRSGFGAWLGCFIGLIALASAAAAYVIRVHSLPSLVAAGALTAQAVICFALGALGYYLATAYGVSKVMLPSVPFASRLRR